MAWDGPLEVLVNRNSASASEIFAAAIQDYGRGLIVGEPTFGKGTVQNLVDLDQMAQNEKPTFGELKMTIQQFFRVNGGSTQLRGVTPEISFPVTADFAQNGEQAFDNSLPWTSIASASYAPTSDLKAIVPLLEARHEARIANAKDWQAYEADIADARKLRKETTISLNEQARRQERDEQEKKRLERHPESATTATAGAPSATGKELASASMATPRTGAPGSVKRVDVEPSDAQSAVGAIKDGKTGTTVTDSPKKDDVDSRTDDGLQADERSLKADLAQEQARRSRRMSCCSRRLAHSR